MAHSIYNFKFDTSNCESSEQEYELKHQMTRLYWANITSFFLQKGKSIKFMYWSDDIKDEYSGYPNSGYGIKKISTSDEHIFHEKVTEDIMIIHAPINGTVKNLLLNSMNEEHITISPFFTLTFYVNREYLSLHHKILEKMFLCFYLTKM